MHAAHRRPQAQKGTRERPEASSFNADAGQVIVRENSHIASLTASRFPLAGGRAKCVGVKATSTTSDTPDTWGDMGWTLGLRRSTARPARGASPRTRQVIECCLISGYGWFHYVAFLKTKVACRLRGALRTSCLVLTVTSYLAAPS